MTDNTSAPRVWSERLAWLSSVVEARQTKPHAQLQHLEQDMIALGATGLSWDEWQTRLEKLISHTPDTASPFFASQLYGGREPASTIADMLASYLNNAMYTKKAAGIQVAVERAVHTAFLSLVNWQQGEATFCPGGSLSNCIGLLLARNSMSEMHTLGASSVSKPLVVYASEEAHYSVRKNAALLGLGKDQVHTITTTKTGQMSVVALRVAIEQDKARNKQPCMLHATSGTTLLGAFDSLPELAAVAQEHQLWFHVDAAWGGGLLFCKQHAHMLDGIDLADSITLDQHKMLGVPLVASMLLIRHPGLLTHYLHEQAEYLFGDSDQSETELGASSLQCGRRNDALKVWAQWQKYGTDGLAQRVDALYQLTQYCAAQIRAHYPQFQLALENPLCNICFTVSSSQGALVSRDDLIVLCQRLETQGVRIGMGRFQGTPLLRCILVNHALTRADVDRLLQHIASSVTAYFG